VIKARQLPQKQEIEEKVEDLEMEVEKEEIVQVEEISEAIESWKGEASWYSRDGCVGCSDTLTMANGQPLDDNALTVAFNQAPLGSKVRIINLANNLVAYAVVTDTGGFERHGRIVDVTPAVRDAIGMKGLAQVKVELIN
jgi:rare lipoprotein A (peptidoglycan hydrolase)